MLNYTEKTQNTYIQSYIYINTGVLKSPFFNGYFNNTDCIIIYQVLNVAVSP